MERQHFAYLLILLMVIALGGIIAYARYNSRDRRLERRRGREYAAHDKRMAERAHRQA